MSKSKYDLVEDFNKRVTTYICDRLRSLDCRMSNLLTVELIQAQVNDHFYDEIKELVTTNPKHFKSKGHFSIIVKLQDNGYDVGCDYTTDLYEGLVSLSRDKGDTTYLGFSNVFSTPEDQYLALGKRILAEGEWIENKRTGVRCKTIINADMVYDCGEGSIFPILTTRAIPNDGFFSIMELIGYLRGYDDAKQFRDIGCNTWNKNANENEAWLNNPNRKGKDDMGRVYGVQGRQWTNSKGEQFDQLAKVVDHLSKGIDDRGEIITFWNPGEFDQGCLRPCMYEHQFSIVNGTLYLNSTQRKHHCAF